MMRELADQGWPGYWITLDGKIWSDRCRDWLAVSTPESRDAPHFQPYRPGGKVKRQVGIAHLIATIVFPNPLPGFGTVHFLDEDKHNATFDNVFRGNKVLIGVARRWRIYYRRYGDGLLKPISTDPERCAMLGFVERDVPYDLI
ncbi:hypothetical protein [Paludisphaera mucosa]|uniref:HNH nuclease domain-containing protein n=1 Tax=Paludisphaera mucosa TaxID=3030827 RepID=A0ABT6FJ18_9BACT|nr:hypothetical protein [Paludisphaera mucosa]MDG3007575.1 hypothetical protein [Paludisphaera mucosa]